MRSDPRSKPGMSSLTSAAPDPVSPPPARHLRAHLGQRPSRTADPTATSRTAERTAEHTETSREYGARRALRGRLHGYAIGAVAAFAILVALAASNTARVKVNWIVGSSHVSLVWLVLFTAILGWLLGMLASARLNWRTRAPRRSGETRS